MVRAEVRLSQERDGKGWVIDGEAKLQGHPTCGMWPRHPTTAPFARSSLVSTDIGIRLGLTKKTCAIPGLDHDLRPCHPRAQPSPPTTPPSSSCSFFVSSICELKLSLRRHHQPARPCHLTHTVPGLVLAYFQR
ncbi:hypothetical protein E2562_008990 [Oryza meyeriana var. granulata]|uniref:Uncharacterized protein n=1 Tax=Oryza meyeriana var. granulata TaxID=110450 RepID=A0A6G1CZT1_9ORYZ|nr:hypothetical protein E2562_008990 [Oryza meyeriana var. granulata]